MVEELAQRPGVFPELCLWDLGVWLLGIQWERLAWSWIDFESRH